MNKGLNKSINIKQLALFTTIFLAVFFAFGLNPVIVSADNRGDVEYHNTALPDSGCFTASPSSPTTLNWVTTIINRSTSNVGIVSRAYHDNTAGCGGTTSQPFGWSPTGRKEYNVGETNQTDFTYNTSSYACGRVQLDAYFSSDLGSGFIGYIINYGVDCQAPTGTVVIISNNQSAAHYTTGPPAFGTQGWNGNHTYSNVPTGQYSVVPDAVSGFTVSVTPSQTLSANGTITFNITYTAIAPTTFTLTINKAGNGSGTVTGAGTYNSGTAVTAGATASSGSTFSGWSGDCNSNGQVTMNSNKTCTATFTLNTFTLTVNKVGNGSGSVTGAGTYNSGTVVTATATANAGSTFTGWSGDCSGTSSSAFVTMNANKTCTTTFALPNTFTLTVNTAGNGSGTVTGAGTYNDGTVVTATATASSGSTFSGWSGDCNSNGQVTMNSNKTCTATFTLNAPTVILTANPTTVLFNASSTLTWVPTNSTSCTASGDWSGSKTSTGGSEIQNNLTINKSYTIVCTGPGGTATSTASVTVGNQPSANLSISKTVDKATANVLDTLTYTMILTNNGPDNATNVVVTDILSNKLNFVGVSSLGTYSTSTGIWTVGNLNNGASVVLSIVATVKAGQEGQIITNTATTSATQTDPSLGNNTSTVTTTVNGTPANGKITFCLILSDINNIIATSSSGLPAGIFSLDLNTSTTSGSTVQTKSWNTGTFSPNKKIIAGVNDADCITFSGLPLGTYYYPQMTVNGALWLVPKYDDQNTQSVNNIFDFFTYSPELFNATSTDDAGRNLNSDGQIILTAGDADKTLVVLEKDDPGLSCPAPQITSPLTVSGVVGSAFTYTVTTISATPVTYSATGLPPGLTFSATTHTITGTPTTAGSYNVTLGAVNTCIGGLDIKILVTTVTTGGGGSPSANLSVLKTVDKATANVLDTLTYTVTVTNAGPDNATGVVLTDILSSKLNLVSTSTSVGTYVTSTGIWTIGNLNNGASASMTITATVKSGQEGQTIPNSATVSATQPDPNSGNNTVTVNTTVNGGGCTSNCGGGGGGGGGYSPNSNLAISKTSDKSIVKVGDDLTFTINVINNGPDNATAVTVTEAIPAGLNFISATTSMGTYSKDGGMWTIGDLKVGSSTTLTIKGTIKDGYQGQTISNIVVVYAAQSDPVPSNNTARVDVPVTGVTTVTTTTPPNGCYYLLDYLRKDFNNNPVEVRKLQVFLRDLEGFKTVQITGVYDDQTIVALDAFQARYASDVLTPWGHTAPTSYTYILTKKKVNEIYCKRTFPVTAQQQIEIDTYRNLSTTPNVLLNNEVGKTSTTKNTNLALVSTTTTATTPSIVSRFTANIVFAWDKLAGWINWCGWLNILLLIIIAVISYFWYREWDRNRKIEEINKEIDLQK